MPKDYFAVERTSTLSDLPDNAAIHLIGVAGVAMGQLAVALADKGYRVSGSDKAFYEPMGSFLRNSSVQLCDGYAAENVPTDVDLVVIGNAVSYGHPEVAVVEERNLPYTCFPKLLYESLISGKRSVVASGTHGKTTTAGYLASTLLELSADPSFFVGGVVHGVSQSMQIGNGAASVVEGDEYDSAFFAKVPKFQFYRPNIWIVTSLEFDHADIYNSIDEIEAEFQGVLKGLSASDQVYVCCDCPKLKEVFPRWRELSPAALISYGFDSKRSQHGQS